MTRNILAGQLIGAVVLLSFALPAAAIDTDRANVRAFVASLSEKHGFAPDYLRGLLAQGESQPKILEAISRPAEKTKPWHEYRAIFITPERIEAGRSFQAEQAQRLDRIAERTGVPAEIMAAIVGVETYFGRITGNYRVLDSLATLAFDYPPRSKFFTGELEQLFLLARDEALDLPGIKGSYAGAMGPPQFIPSSYRAYAVDGDGDGRRDLLGNWDDILASVANYFVRHGWQPGQPIATRGTPSGSGALPRSDNQLAIDSTLRALREQGIRPELPLADDTPAALFELAGETETEYWIGFKNLYVITRYNRSVMYALAVFELSEALRAEPANAVAVR
jgi:membrane-bound lytic murein transglycosylase B